jgi:hypothetical protein
VPNWHKEMDMRTLLFPVLIAALLSSTSVVADGPTTLGYTNNRNIEPVLVRVNAQGKVTDVRPAYRLSPELKRLLLVNLTEMIHTPATDKDGKPMSTQFVINVALQYEPRSTGDYDVHFVYVSATPLPLGTWFWSRDPFGQLGLASPNILSSYPVSTGFTPSVPTGPIFGANSPSSTSGGHSGGSHSH